MWYILTLDLFKECLRQINEPMFTNSVFGVLKRIICMFFLFSSCEASDKLASKKVEEIKNIFMIMKSDALSKCRKIFKMLKSVCGEVDFFENVSIVSKTVGPLLVPKSDTVDERLVNAPVVKSLVITVILGYDYFFNNSGAVPVCLCFSILCKGKTL